MTEIALSRVTDWARVGERWRALEARSDCSFFQSWTWTGCLAEERFTDPILLKSARDGRVVAMALFNRRRGVLGRETLWLGENGDPRLDTPYIEWNGVMAEAGTSPDVIAACLQAARSAPIDGDRPRFGRRIALSGVDAATIAAAQRIPGGVVMRREAAAPYVDLADLRQTKRNYLEALSSNTRYQLRRSARTYAAGGELVLRRAQSQDEARAFLAALAALHQTTWTGRGRPGAFAEPWFGRFHHALIDRGLERDEVAPLRLTAGERVVGYLYNFEYRGTVLAYQSGFDYAGAGRHEAPGLTCHHQAIIDAASRGIDRYDFLAGEDRYKRSLATSEARLHWAVLGSGWPGPRFLQRLAHARSTPPSWPAKAGHPRLC